MNILMINKFLYPNGGSETYVIKLGETLTRLGHEVQYFGMEHEGRILGNRVNAYTKDMDFHNAGFFDKLTYPVRIIYSSEARRKIRKVLDDFKPDVCHINNFNYQLTPSIILEINKWRRETKHACKIIYTAHDFQLVCPNHMAFIPDKGERCLECAKGKFGGCTSNKCIHGSTMKSTIGTMEATYWKLRKTYKLFDTVICCSEFMKQALDNNPLLKDKTVAIHNFIEQTKPSVAGKEDYVLYFGRFSFEKGMRNLIEACKRLPEIDFVFAGKGEFEREINELSNVRNVGFKSGDELNDLIAKARFSVYPSIWYENCPYSVMESISLGTPVLGSNAGGIPELIDDGVTGYTFDSLNVDELTDKIHDMWSNRDDTELLSKNCLMKTFESDTVYCERLMEYYK